jgi:hypothetical protein
MTDFLKDELAAPKVVDRSTFHAAPNAFWGFERRLTQEKATPLRPPADGSPWSRRMAPHRSLANVER